MIVFVLFDFGPICSFASFEAPTTLGDKHMMPDRMQSTQSFLEYWEVITTETELLK